MLMQLINQKSPKGSKTILARGMPTADHSPELIISEAHLMGFELRNEKLDNFQEDEEIDLGKKQMWVNK